LIANLHALKKFRDIGEIENVDQNPDGDYTAALVLVMLNGGGPSGGPGHASIHIRKPALMIEGVSKSGWDFIGEWPVSAEHVTDLAAERHFYTFDTIVQKSAKLAIKFV
tara:strand:+ start:96556 stop:96882 length:327 start_codon:yes stop_codon:yes gene_type:complete